jgi:hypothetical protein
VAERRLEVIATDAEGVDLRALGACSECRGCGGRCDLFQSSLRLPHACFPYAPQGGQRWRAVLGDRELLQQSLRGHGALLAGLVFGAAAGRTVALAGGWPPDAATAAAALLGTLLALRLSKRTPGADLRLLPDAPGP